MVIITIMHIHPLIGKRDFPTRDKNFPVKRKRESAAVGGGGLFALGFEGLGHGGRRGETTQFGDIGQAVAGVLMDERNGITHTVLTNHVVERLIATAPDNLGQILRVGTETRDKRIDGDVRLGEYTFLVEQMLQLARQFIVMHIAE